MAKRPPFDSARSYKLLPTSKDGFKASRPRGAAATPPDPTKSHKLIPASSDRMKASSFRLDAATLERVERVAAAYAALSLPVSRGAILRQAVELGLAAVEAKLQALARIK
jgi:hypothetical protein